MTPICQKQRDTIEKEVGGRGVGREKGKRRVRMEEEEEGRKEGGKRSHDSCRRGEGNDHCFSAVMFSQVSAAQMKAPPLQGLLGTLQRKRRKRSASATLHYRAPAKLAQ